MSDWRASGRVAEAAGRHRRRWRRVLWTAAALAFATLGLTALTWHYAKSRTHQLAGALVASVPTTQPLVALTFDDGPTPAAMETLLPMLRERGVRATFFVVGVELERHPALGAALLADGHELGNHSYTHQRMVLKSAAFIADEVERTDALIRRAGQQGEILFRPPYGVKLLGLPRYLERTGRRTVMWSIAPDSDPAIADSAAAITASVLAQVRPGAIILLHPMYRRRASLEAVPAIIAGLQARGLRLVTVSELLAASDDPRHRE